VERRSREGDSRRSSSAGWPPRPCSPSSWIYRYSEAVDLVTKLVDERPGRQDHPTNTVVLLGIPTKRRESRTRRRLLPARRLRFCLVKSAVLPCGRARPRANRLAMSGGSILGRGGVARRSRVRRRRRHADLWDYPDDVRCGGRVRSGRPARRASCRRSLGIPPLLVRVGVSSSRAKSSSRSSMVPEGRTPSPASPAPRGQDDEPLRMRTPRRDDHRHPAITREKTVNGRPCRAAPTRDHEKDQRYFLYTLSARQLARLEFPLGNATKPRCVRRAAARPCRGGQGRESGALLRTDRTLRRIRRGAALVALVRVPSSTDRGRVVGTHARRPSIHHRPAQRTRRGPRYPGLSSWGSSPTPRWSASAVPMIFCTRVPHSPTRAFSTMSRCPSRQA